MRRLHLLIALAVLLLDRFTKRLVAKEISLHDSITVIKRVFYITHVENRGAAFGLFAESTSEWRTVLLIGFSVVALIALIVMLWRSSRLDRKTAIALALILGGAVGNVFDRVRWGSVTDFLLFYIGSHQWPAFNAADSAIVIGSGLLLLDFVKFKRQPAHTQNVS